MHFSDFLSCKPVPGDASVSSLIWLWECKISSSQSGGSWPAGWWRGGTESTSDPNTRDSLRWYGVMRKTKSLWMSEDVYSIAGYLGMHTVSEGGRVVNQGATTTPTFLSGCRNAGCRLSRLWWAKRPLEEGAANIQGRSVVRHRLELWFSLFVDYFLFL